MACSSETSESLGEFVALRCYVCFGGSLSDLVPKENVESWLKHFRKELPAIAFKASTQQQRDHLVSIHKNRHTLLVITSMLVVHCEHDFQYSVFIKWYYFAVNVIFIIHFSLNCITL